MEVKEEDRVVLPSQDLDFRATLIVVFSQQSLRFLFPFKTVAKPSAVNGTFDTK